MPSLILLVGFLYLIYTSVTTFINLFRNIQKARSSGIVYVVVPVYYLNRFWLVTHRLYLPLLAKLPRRWTWWVDFCLPDFNFNYSIEVFQRMGHDTFLLVSPGGIIMHTADPAVIHQITTRRNDFPKPTAIYRSLDIYGKNVVSTEGSMWRQHRKATSPPFTEKNNHLVWAESIDLANAMLSSWVGPDGKGGQTVDRVMDDTMRLSLYVISRAGFGRKLEWPSADAKADIDINYNDASKIQNQKDDRDGGHSMSYTYAIHCLLDNILFQFLLPRWVMARIPIKLLQKANEAYLEWGNYMREAVMSKKEKLKAGEETKDQMDILSQLVKNQMNDSSKDIPLTDSEVLGNMFVLILAGHETAANSIHFSLLFLALFPQTQRAVQKDLDRIFEGRPPSQWDYDRDLPSLFGGMVGAVLAEELRLVPPVIGIPKSTWGVTDQPISIEGKQCTVPGGIYISLATTNVQKNPKYWPTNKPTLPGGRPVHPVANIDNDLEEFRPERWLLDEDGEVSTTAASEKKEMPNEAVTSDGLGINEAADTSDRLFKPARGAYIPFSDGYRACLGRRFAQVEVLAVLAVLLQRYSVELAVDRWASDEEVIVMNENDRVDVWQKAANRARDLMLNGLSVMISLQMRKGTVPLRFVPRGKERFPDDADQQWKDKHPDLLVGAKPVSDYRCWG
ncbi:putative P450 monooxygenase [Exophiala oligosperma]